MSDTNLSTEVDKAVREITATLDRLEERLAPYNDRIDREVNPNVTYYIRSALDSVRAALPRTIQLPKPVGSVISLGGALGQTRYVRSNPGAWSVLPMPDPEYDVRFPDTEMTQSIRKYGYDVVIEFVPKDDEV